MVDINFMPWRKQQRLYEQRVIKQMLVGLLVTIILPTFTYYFYLCYQVEELNVEVNALEQQLSQLSQPSLLASDQQEKLNQYQEMDGLYKSFFVALGAPDASQVCFTSISSQHNKLAFVGRARSAADLTTFLHHWQAATLFSDIQIERLQRDVKPNLFFHFKANIQSPL